jgi:hypothetical protein
VLFRFLLCFLLHRRFLFRLLFLLLFFLGSRSFVAGRVDIPSNCSSYSSRDFRLLSSSLSLLSYFLPLVLYPTLRLCRFLFLFLFFLSLSSASFTMGYRTCKRAFHAIIAVTLPLFLLLECVTKKGLEDAPKPRARDSQRQDAPDQSVPSDCRLYI